METALLIFSFPSTDLCHSLALMARRLCTSFVDPLSLAPFLSCRLITLDKNPGVCPIGIGEQIVTKAVLTVLGTDYQKAAGSNQLCAGQISGVEAAVHAVHDSFNSDSCQAALLIDATNAFNCLNREAALHNIQHLCPSFSTILINTTELFADGSTILSQEGTTQGDPLDANVCPRHSTTNTALIH